MPTQIRASGGGTVSPLWRQILADVLGTEIATVNTSRARPRRRVAGRRGGGLVRDGRGGGGRLRHRHPGCHARSVGGRYAQAYATYRELYPALAPIFPRL